MIQSVPQHIAIIMDGNGRWARSRNQPRIFGHRNGAKATREVVDECGKIGISYLTLFVFSSENWHRPSREVKFLMSLLVEMLDKEIKNLHKNGVRLQAVGDLSKLPDGARKKLEDGIRLTENNEGLQLNLAISYGGRQEIVDACKKISRKVQEGALAIEDLDESEFRDHLYLSDVPDPDLLIRTGGEYRISNYLLWQAAYSEFYFTPVLWPDFTRAELHRAIEFYSTRERRFGRITED